MPVTTEDSSTAVRPFEVGFSDAEIADLRRRISATRWPERETVSDDSQGAGLDMMRALADYWATDYDWRKCEAKLNALPNFITEIDGLDIHFIHVRSQHQDALPLIVTHGWPGSIIEQLKIIDPLTNPTAHGASAADAFDLVIPSLPGHGFSAKPTSTGWDPARIARAWTQLMNRLKYTQFVAQGGDWGAAVTKRWASKPRRDCSPSTPTCPAPPQPNSSKDSSKASPRHPTSQAMSYARTSSSAASTPRTSPTP